MSLYHILTIYLLSFSFLVLDFVRGRYRKYVYVSFVILLIYSAGVKDENTSSDTFNYVTAYNSAPDLSGFGDIDTFFYEPGYTFIQAVFKTITDDYTLFFLFIASCSIIIYAVIIWKESPWPFFSLFIYVSFFYFTREIIVIRYGLASAIMLIAIQKAMENKYKAFVCYSILAFMFHYTALSAILLWIVLKIPICKRMIYMEYIVCFSILCYVVGISILNIVIYMSQYLPPFFAFAINKGLKYLETESSYGIKQIIPLLPYLYVAYLLKKKSILTSYYWFLLFIITLMLQLNQAVTLARIGQMYLVVIIIYFPLLIKSLSLRNGHIMYLVTIVYCIYSFVRITFFNTGGFINVY